MPIYEFRCNACNRKTEVFVHKFNSPSNATCTHCGSNDLNRIFSKFAVRRSKNDKSVYDDILSDRKLTDGLMRNDPRALAEWSRKMSRAADEDITPETEELMDRLDAGADVSEVMEAMKPPELSGDDDWE
ncbi:MAG: zinc ribbon domain-containing protein [Dehalococcoidia bacterium]|nr:MAG: zinc ribbon domain-containing protein [Dehalococcoidia bacterium]UCG84475.1 MAG: zinc ribbon domain-containing protein [Dehalococcoidia bacterium]